MQIYDYLFKLMQTCVNNVVQKMSKLCSTTKLEVYTYTQSDRLSDPAKSMNNDRRTLDHEIYY